MREKNRQALEWLDEWLGTPDDLGEEWWENFHRELATNRFTARDRA